jgi:hypothetical protein
MKILKSYGNFKEGEAFRCKIGPTFYKKKIMLDIE